MSDYKKPSLHGAALFEAQAGGADPAEITAAGVATPVFLAHGSADSVIGLERAEASRDLLHSLGCVVDWNEYPMPHSVCSDEIDAIGEWLQRVLN